MPSQAGTGSSGSSTSGGTGSGGQARPDSPRKPHIAVVYSDSSKHSLESKHLAYYLTGMLCLTGYCHVHLIALPVQGPGEAESTHFQLPNDRISILPSPSSSKPVEIPVSDYSFSHWSTIAQCHVVIVTVNSNDTEAFVSKFQHVIETKKNVPIFCMQRGVKNSTLLKEKLETAHGHTVVEGVCGFAVVPHQRFRKALTATTARPCLLFERLSREATKSAEGPLNLIEKMNFQILYRKGLTPFTWGLLAYEASLYPLSMLSMLPIRQTLRDGRWRRILALMTREFRVVFSLAAGGGKWKPDLLIVSSYLSLWSWEMLLMLPTWLFSPLAGWLQVIPSDDSVFSPHWADLQDGRQTMVEHHLGEFLKTAKTNKYNASMCRAVYNECIASTNQSPSARALATEVTERAIRSLEDTVVETYGRLELNSTETEFYFYVMRGVLLISAIPFSIILMITLMNLLL